MIARTYLLSLSWPRGVDHDDFRKPGLPGPGEHLIDDCRFTAEERRRLRRLRDLMPDSGNP